MRIVIAGGTGQIGSVLRHWFLKKGHEVVILSRSKPTRNGAVHWNGQDLGSWVEWVDGSDVVINLAGRSVDCRYSAANLKEMMDSRVSSTRVIGQAIEGSSRPPGVWLQMSTATIYAHRFDAANDEVNGIIGGEESAVPPKWKASVDIAKAWEATLNSAHTPRTRKVAMRTAMMMGTGRASVFHVLSKMTRAGLGGPIAGGAQYVSWIHELDLVRAVDALIHDDGFEGPVNLASPNPLPQRAFMEVLRGCWKAPFGLPATSWMAEIGAFILRTETELLFKSRRVIPTHLLSRGFEFQFAKWQSAASDLVSRLKRGHLPIALPPGE